MESESRSCRLTGQPCPRDDCKDGDYACWKAAGEVAVAIERYQSLIRINPSTTEIATRSVIDMSGNKALELGFDINFGQGIFEMAKEILNQKPSA